MNRRNTRVLILFAVLMSLLAISAAPAFAGSASVSGVFPAGGSPTMPVVSISSPNCISQSSTQVQYDAYAFTVDAAGSYTLNVSFASSPGRLISLYLMNSSFNPASPLASCLAADNSAPISVSASLAANITYYAVPFDDTFAQPGGSYTLTISGPGNVYFAGGGGTASIDDGRLNAFDLAAPFALYCAADSFDIYAIDSAGAGALALRVGSDAIAATDSAAANALVAEGGGIRVFKLTTGELQAVSAPDFEGKVYNVLFSAFPCLLKETFLN